MRSAQKWVRRAPWLLAFVGLASATLVLSCQRRGRAAEEFIERVTDLHVTDFVTHDYDNAEHIALYRIQLDEDARRSFVQRADVSGDAFFASEASGEPYSILVFPLGGEAPPLPKAGEGMLFVRGCTESNAWFGLIDPSTGVMWLNVFYPDWGGDPPGCNMVHAVRRCGPRLSPEGSEVLRLRDSKARVPCPR